MVKGWWEADGGMVVLREGRRGRGGQERGGGFALDVQAAR